MNHHSIVYKLKAHRTSIQTFLGRSEIPYASAGKAAAGCRAAPAPTPKCAPTDGTVGWKLEPCALPKSDAVCSVAGEAPTTEGSTCGIKVITGKLNHSIIGFKLTLKLKLKPETQLEALEEEEDTQNQEQQKKATHNWKALLKQDQNLLNQHEHNRAGNAGHAHD